MSDNLTMKLCEIQGQRCRKMLKYYLPKPLYFPIPLKRKADMQQSEMSVSNVIIESLLQC